MRSNKILEKIRKLMSLAEGSEGNEAEVAARMADKLMRAHAVSLADLREADLLEADPVCDHEMRIGRSAWMANLAWALATHCNVTAVRGRRWRTVIVKGNGYWTKPHLPERANRTWVPGKQEDLRIVTVMCGYGHKSDLEVWEYLYTVAEREVHRLAKAYRKQWGFFGPSRTEMTMFREGCVSGLAQKLGEQREEAKSSQPQTTALAVQSRMDRAQAECARQNPKLGTFRGGVGSSSAGVRAGRDISLRAGVTGSNTSSTKLLGGE